MNANGSGQRAVIVGAGVAGLAVDALLRGTGWDTIVLERDAEAAAPARAELVWTNGVAALERLGIAEAVRARAEPLEGERFLSAGGRLLYEVPVGELARRKGVAQPLVVRRGDLHAALLELSGDAVRRGRAVTAVEDDGSGVTVVAGGGVERGTLVVGADGAESVVRRRPGTPEEAETPLRWLTGFARIEHPVLARGASNLSFGRGVRFGTRDAGEEVFWYAVTEDGGRIQEPSARKAALELLVREFHTPIPELVAATAAEDIGDTAPPVLPRLGRWAVGRVVLAGDAARAASPSYARGTGEALVDAAVLAGLLSERRDIAGTLWQYERRRRPAADELRRQAAKLDRVSAWRNPVRVRLRETVMKGVIGPRTPARVERELDAGAL